MRILIAESSSLIRGRIIKLLSALKNVEMIKQAKNVRELLEYNSKFKLNVIILEDRLENSNTLDLLEEIKKSAHVTKVIILTDTVYLLIKEKYLEAGANYVFHKSNEFDSLVATIETIEDWKNNNLN